jgi:rod shape-determining protein MreC
MRDNPRTRLVLVVLLLTAFTLITLDARGGGTSLLDRLRASTQSVFGPIERAAAAVVRPVSNFVDGIGSIGSNEQRISELEQQNEELALQLRTSEVDRNRARELDQLLGLAALGQYRIVPAEVIAVGSARGFIRTVTIDAGSRDGITVDLTVVNGEGLVGRVIEVGSSTSTILLLTDPEFVVGVRMAGSMELGTVRGGADGPMSLELFNPQADLQVGDLMVTLGSRNGRPFVPGVPVGTVLSVRSTPGALTRSADVGTFVDVTTLDLVGVVVEPPRTDPRDSLLPTPTPSTTASPGSTTPAPTPTP